MKIIKVKTEEHINLFLKLPKMLYSKKNNMEDSSDIRKFLTKEHYLSKYFKLHAYIIMEDKEIVGRFALTIYPDDPICYLGFYECINDDKTSKFLFDSALKEAKKLNCKKIVGPVDASFWHKYRLKINLFDKIPYTGEPYNKDYYFKQFKDNKYKVIEHYTSNIYEVIKDDYENSKYKSHYDEFIEKGYDIRSSSLKEYDKLEEELYYLFTDLYSDFPTYKYIEKEDFINMFMSYKKIVDMSMVKVAYKDDKLVGFFVSFPNYNNLVYNLNLINILKVLKLRKKPKEFVLMYMGVDKNHTGLGKALAYDIILELKKNKLPSIGALARDGKITQNYAEDLIDTRYEYVLLERKVS